MHVVPAPEDVVGPSANPDLEVVSGGRHDPQPVTHGLRLIRELLRARSIVLFSIRPEGPIWHAALGEESARLATVLGREIDTLSTCIQGPTILLPERLIPERAPELHLDGYAQQPSPLPGVMILAERKHRGLTIAVGAVIPERMLPSETSSLRFAQSIFQDLTRCLLRDRPAPKAHQNLETRWQKSCVSGIVGASPQMRQVFRVVEKLAHSDVNVLILGESGTGKEMVARAIHESGRFKGQKFVAQNCAALPETLLESELFGHCRGAFTGAQVEKRGLFEEAHEGSFFLDEIADMPIPLQIKMLRVLQEGEIRRLGETRTRSVNVRIIAATNKVLANEVTQGRFREDLFYRLNVVKMELPPLRRRPQDIPLLAMFFADKIRTRMGRPPLGFSSEALQRMLEHDWPGNVRELENEIERLVALHGDEGEIQPWMLSERLRYGATADASLDKLGEIHDLHRATEYLERAMIARSLERHSWNKSKAAVELGVSRQGLIKKVKRLRLVRPGAPVRRFDAVVARQLELSFGDADDGAATLAGD
jgi:transcriptional regulator with PAS, ATPase and Fis domain